ncbi:glycerate kinase [Herbiconiux sp. L3-i23]|uniref:glycerate kinase n=1 Tax=Herbiconiux sp. L3-i23 TaxID=2905871 RepID=UPI00204FD1E5|nr:glycerate kinase [Herbiconiux sp. L3-i23]BDI23130.1 hypothetical protein L3i23_19060 [Herbiconiux sp. L3-i23]
MRVVIAPDSFKGSASATQVASALADGWRDEYPDDTLVPLPMADGGEGTLDAFVAAVPDALRMPVTVDGPDGREHDTFWVRLPDGTGVVELAATSGLPLMLELDPMGADSRGFGQAIAAALDDGVEALLLAIGGSASTDGGAGVLGALGARLTDRHGDPIAGGNTGLHALTGVDLDRLRPLPSGGAIVLTDVRSPLLGSSGSAAVFGPQKGADADQVTQLEEGLRRFAARVPGDTDAPGAGAAGGVGFGLQVWGARMRSGAEAVARLIGLDEAVADADLVITGEGRFDTQSAEGKTVSTVLRIAADTDTAAGLVAGSIVADTSAFRAAVDLSRLAGDGALAYADPLPWLREAGAGLARAVAGASAGR